MKNYRMSGLITLLIMAISMSIPNVAAKTHRATTGAAKHKKTSHRAKMARFGKAKRRHSDIDKNTLTKNMEQHKLLDLAVPFKEFDIPDTTRKINSVEDSAGISLFDENGKKQGALQVKGQFVMSQDPEADKKKSADGAGITINLRR